MPQYALHTSIGLIYTNALREYYSTHKLTQSYRWSTDETKRDLEIVEQWPETPQNFPLIVIDTVYSGEAEKYLSDGAQDLLVDGNFEGRYLSGADNFEVRFNINDHSKTGVDEVADLLIWGLNREIERSVWDASLMTVIPQHGARSAGAGARPYTDRDLLYFVTISQPVKTHWFDEVIYDQKILTYLATAERDGLADAATSFQMQAGG